jgi:hypothetical protein
MIVIDKYTALEIKDEGQYGYKILEGYIDKAGEFRPSFVKREFGRDKVEKTVPLSIKLGSDPVKALTELLNAISIPF